MVKIYGIKNCDTMKKAFKWLDENDVSYDFHDYKKQGADADVLTRAIAAHGWDSVINKRGTSWRKLDANTQSAMSDESAVQAVTPPPKVGPFHKLGFGLYCL